LFSRENNPTGVPCILGMVKRKAQRGMPLDLCGLSVPATVSGVKHPGAGGSYRPSTQSGEV
jgi:hypothetical protein